MPALQPLFHSLNSILVLPRAGQIRKFLTRLRIACLQSLCQLCDLFVAKHCQHIGGIRGKAIHQCIPKNLGPPELGLQGIGLEVAPFQIPVKVSQERCLRLGIWAKERGQLLCWG